MNVSKYIYPAPNQQCQCVGSIEQRPPSSYTKQTRDADPMATQCRASVTDHTKPTPGRRRVPARHKSERPHTYKPGSMLVHRLRQHRTSTVYRGLRFAGHS